MWKWKKQGEPGGGGGDGGGAEPSRPDGSEAVPENLDQGPEGDLSTGPEIQERIGQLEAELEDARSRALRVMADFQNYQRRALQNENVARQLGLGALATSVVGVIDHFDHALNQQPKTPEARQVLAGLNVIREELIKALQQHGVTPINPAPNDEFVPGRHEAIMQKAQEGVEPGHIVSTFQPGYALSSPGAAPGGERVLRAAKVAVAPTEPA
jgi:molecular chaperone GrpE